MIGENRSQRMRPVIGITAYAEEATWGAWTLPAALIPLSYVRAVERAGGRALLVPPSDDGVEETLDRLDGAERRARWRHRAARPRPGRPRRPQGGRRHLLRAPRDDRARDAGGRDR